ncbi:MAG: glycosyltransferase family 2 protein, partial [Moheibacter sp.]
QQSISRTHNERGLDMFVAVNSVKEAFESSSQKDFVKEWKRFFILQGYYSFLAYVAYVQDKKIRHQLIERLKSELQENQISKSEILNYKRFNRNYLFSLPLKKQVFYLLSLLSFKLIESGPR